MGFLVDRVTVGHVFCICSQSHGSFSLFVCLFVCRQPSNITYVMLHYILHNVTLHYICNVTHAY